MWVVRYYILGHFVLRNPSTDLCTISAIAVSHFESPSVERVKKICVAQEGYVKLVGRFRYLEQSALPQMKNLHGKLLWRAVSMKLFKGVLYFEPDSSPGHLCLVAPESLHSVILQEAHAGCIAGHFAFKKLYDHGNNFVVCFMDYLTKWVEAFAISDQHAETIAVCRACSLQAWCT